MDDIDKRFEEWWTREGQGVDPDDSDVPWFDKRKGLAAEAFRAAMYQSGNYVADDDTYPDQVTFANGRVVRVQHAIGQRSYLGVGKVTP